MRSVLVTMFAALATTILAACALLQPQVMPAYQRSARLVLAAYETTQQAILVYGRLPGCSGVPVYPCRNDRLWRKLQAADHIASTAIVAAAPVLEGAMPEGGEVIAALNAILAVRAAIDEASATMREIKP